MLRKKRAFINGSTQKVIPVMPENTGAKKPDYAPFHPVGDVVPIEAKECLMSSQDYSKLFAPESAEDGSTNRNAENGSAAAQ